MWSIFSTNNIPIIPLTIDIFSTIGTYSWIAPTGINQWWFWNYSY